MQLPVAMQVVQVPLLQTLLFPHDIPFMTFPASMQTEVPVMQDVMPVLHWLAGWQLAPDMQEMHIPPLQTLLVPHDIPSPTLPDSMQAEVPDVQEVMPVLHGLVGWQLVPVVQAPQVPLSQTLLAPQEVPFATLPDSMQAEVPDVQEVVPVLHMLVGWQVACAVQSPHAPALQTLLVPQEAPFARFWPVSEQAIAGEQTMTPAWQALLGVQAAPAVQATQLPLLQTMLVPQEVPFAVFPESVHTGAPVLHAVVPVWQGLPVTAQLAPVWQATQAPVLLQTLFVPQTVPAETVVPWSLQTGVPVEQTSVPWWHPFVGTQAAPFWQSPHCPERHTIAVPHDMPFG
jgi:hypothetical protein